MTKNHINDFSDEDLPPLPVALKMYIKRKVRNTGRRVKDAFLSPVAGTKYQREETELDEVLSKQAPPGRWINDFVHSDNPKFAGKSKKKRIKMALAAYYSKQRNEDVDLDENSFDITKLSHGRLKWHVEKKMSHGRFTRKEIKAEHERRKRYEPDYNKAKPSLDESTNIKAMIKVIVEDFVNETRMPSSVIKGKERLNNKSPEDLYAGFKEVATRGGANKPVETVARETAWRHGYGKMSSHYWDKIKHIKEDSELNEISKERLGKYVKKASASHGYNMALAGDQYRRAEDMKKDDAFTVDNVKKVLNTGKKADRNAGKRRYWHDKAVDKLTKEETELEEGMRLIKTHTEGPHSAKVYKDTEWGEHRVKFFKNGKHEKNGDYHTDDVDDAHETAKSQLKKMNK